MGRISASGAKDLYSAYASVYEGYGKGKKEKDCVTKSEKGDHNCAKKVCHEEYGEGETIFGQHAAPDENGFVSHYNVQFEHGIVENVSVEDMEVLTMEAHGEHVEHEGELIDENRYGNVRGQAARANREAAAAQGSGTNSFTDRRNARRSASPAAQANTNKVGQNVGTNRARPASGYKVGKMYGKDVESPKPSSTPVGKSGTKPATSTPAPAAKPAAPAATPAAPAGGTMASKEPMTAAGNKVSNLEALRAKARADTIARKRTPASTPMGGGRRMREEFDVFDVILEHLIEEGYAETEEAALAIMTNMSEEWRKDIVEGSCGGGSKAKKKKKSGY